MFSQRKSFFKGKLFYIVLLGLFVFGIWLNQAPVEKNSPDEVNTDSNYPASTDKANNQPDNESYDIMDNIIGSGQIPTSGGIENPTDSENTEETVDSGYYLVKEVDGVINIFFYDEQGKESLIRETDIAFSLLSVADQALFQKGIIKHTAEELNDLLQDFES
ncbi:MAG: hypothetical protein AAGU75_11290 [Bacillota bacterium]